MTYRKENRMRGLLHGIQLNRRKIVSVMLILFTMNLLTSCANKGPDTSDNETEENVTKVYYINAEETEVVGEKYNPKGRTPEEQIEEYLKALSTAPKNIVLKKAKPDDVTVQSKLNEDGRLGLYFNSNYNNLTGTTEVLCRAAIVKTLCQIEGVDSIEFYVNNEPLKGYNGQSIGAMEAKDFINNMTEDVFVRVYFSNSKGNALVPSNLKITYDGNVSIEQLIIERLISGPIEKNKNMIKTLPEGTELIKVTTNDGICYVDFNEKFLNNLSNIKDEVVIYSVVNSLDELSTVKKVQFTINGAVKKTYKEDIPFDGFFGMKLELIEGSK